MQQIIQCCYYRLNLSAFYQALETSGYEKYFFVVSQTNYSNQ